MKLLVGASDGNISCVIEDREVNRATSLLCDHLFPTERLPHRSHLEAVAQRVP